MAACDNISGGKMASAASRRLALAIRKSCRYVRERAAARPGISARARRESSIACQRKHRRACWLGGDTAIFEGVAPRGGAAHAARDERGDMWRIKRSAHFSRRK